MAYAHQPSHLQAFVTAQKFGSSVHFALLATGAVVQATDEVALPEGFQQLRKPGDSRFLAFTTQKADAALATLEALGWRVEMAVDTPKPAAAPTPAPRPVVPARPAAEGPTLDAGELTGPSPWTWIRTATLAARAHLKGAEVTAPVTLPQGQADERTLVITGGGKPWYIALGDDRTTHRRTCEDTLVDLWALTLLAPTTGFQADIRPEGLVLTHQGRDVAVLERDARGWTGRINGQGWGKPLADYRAILDALHTRRVGRTVHYGLRCPTTKAFFQGWDGLVARFGAQPRPEGLHTSLKRCLAFFDAHGGYPTATKATPQHGWDDLPRVGKPQSMPLARVVELVSIDRQSGRVVVHHTAADLAQRARLRAQVDAGVGAQLGDAAVAAVFQAHTDGRMDVDMIVAIRPDAACPKATSGVARLPIAAALRRAGLGKDDAIAVKTTLPAQGVEVWSVGLRADDVDTLLHELPNHSVVAVAPAPTA